MFTKIKPGKWRRYSAVAVTVVALLGLGACATSDTTETSVESDSSGKVHAAFAGGGWRAHSGHTGWIASALEDGKTVEGTFTNVDTISSNSGGSWFSTMLMYSPKFKSSLDAGNSAAWLTDQKVKYKAHPDCHRSGEATGCILIADYESDWRKFISDFVVDPAWIDQSTPLSTPEPWAINKTLLLAATMLTRDVVLGGSTFGDKDFYWNCSQSASPVLRGGIIGRRDGDKGGFCDPSFVPDVVPVTFSRSPSGGNTDFLKGPGAGYKLAYSKNVLRNAPLEVTSAANPLSSSGTKTINAAAASSAAAGFVASGHVSGDWEESYKLSDLAISFSLKNGEVRQAVVPSTFSNLKKNHMVRLADGGVVDNTGVSQLVSALQKQSSRDPITIVAFDNYQHPYGQNGLSDEFQYMLGLKSANGVVSFFGYDVNIPNLTIFNKPAVMPLPVRSPLVLSNCKNASNNDALYYYELQLVTKANGVMGVAKDRNVTLHIFASASPVPTEPADVDKDFDCYSDLLSSIKNDMTMRPLLKRALAIP